MSEDSVRPTASAALSINSYIYCSNNPVNLIDPFGLSNVTKVVFHWWGFSLYLSSLIVKNIVLGYIGATTAVLCSITSLGWVIMGGIVGAVGGNWASNHNFRARIVDYNWLTGIRSIYYQ